MITVRYFAAAAEAAGRDTETFDPGTVDNGASDNAASDNAASGAAASGAATSGALTSGAGPSDHATPGPADGTTAGALRRAMVTAHGPELERVLARCSLLAAGRRLPDDAAPVPDGVTVDVLPPFAGG